MMLLTTFSFFLSSLLPLLLPTHGSRLFLQIFLSVYVCGKDVGSSPIVTTTASCKLITTGFIRDRDVEERATLERPFFTITQCWNISTGDPTRYHMSRTKPPPEITIHSCLRTKRFLLHV
ncbi:hypothetical protein YC2023_046049 [Brassica napus]